jgi:hypothetical protein
VSKTDLSRELLPSSSSFLSGPLVVEALGSEALSTEALFVVSGRCGEQALVGLETTQGLGVSLNVQEHDLYRTRVGLQIGDPFADNAVAFDSVMARHLAGMLTPIWCSLDE